jgi:hypothetical protein
LFEGAFFYGIDEKPRFPVVGHDFSRGMVPKNYLILGYWRKNICTN